MTIRDSIIHTSDDGIAVKSGEDYNGRQFGMPSMDILIENVTVIGGDPIAIGSGMSGGVSGVTVRNTTLINTSSALWIKTGPGRGGIVERILYEDIILDSINDRWGGPKPSCVPGCGGVTGAVWIETSYASSPGKPNRSGTPIVRDIAYRNVRGTAGLPLSFQGTAAIPITNVTMENVDISSIEVPARDAVCEGVTGTMKNVSINGRLLDTCLNRTEHLASKSDDGDAFTLALAPAFDNTPRGWHSERQTPTTDGVVVLMGQGESEGAQVLVQAGQQALRGVTWTVDMSTMPPGLSVEVFPIGFVRSGPCPYSTAGECPPERPWNCSKENRCAAQAEECLGCSHMGALSLITPTRGHLTKRRLGAGPGCCSTM